MLRNSKVGQAARFVEFGEPVDGGIVSIDTYGLRCVATDKGYVYKTPEELQASDADPLLREVERLAPGDVVVLFNGMRRTVALVVPVGTPVRYRVTFEEDDKALGIFREQTATPGSLYRLASAAE